jgi:hypothetical protein
MAAENMADIQVYEINGSRPESLSSQVAKKFFPFSSVHIMLDSKLPIIDKEILLEPFLEPGENIAVSNLYKNGPIILFCLRSASCFMCRRMTKAMMDHRDTFASYGVTLYCVLKERVGAQEFVNEYWNIDQSTILVDKQFDLYRILGDGKGDFRYMNINSAFNPQLWGNIKQALSEGHRWGGHFLSQNTILGGTVLVSQSGEIIYQSIESTAGELPNIQGLLDASMALYHQDSAANDYEKALSADSLLSLGIDFSRCS